MAEENTTILILKGVKKVRSIKINRRRIRLAIYAVSVFSIALVFSIGLNVYQYIYPGFPGSFTENVQSDNNPSLSQIASENEEIANNNISSPDDSQEGINGENGQVLLETETIEENEDIFAGDIDSETIGLVNWVYNLSPGDKELDVSFAIYIKDNSNRTVSGTYIILAKTSDTNNPYICSNPEIIISAEGTVPNYYRGDSFRLSIRTPPKTGKLILPDTSTSFEYFRILVYSSSGELLLQKTRTLSNTF